MRLHALVFALFVLRARAATLPDKADIEKKLINVVKEVLDKDQLMPDNISSEQELVDQANAVKDVENNLKSTQVADIPVKVIVEEVKPEVMTDADKKEDNEVVPESEESTEIKRAEVDLKNTGPPQRMQHDTQNPEHFDDSQQVKELKSQTIGSWWRNSLQFDTIQNDLQTLKDSFVHRVDSLSKAIQSFTPNVSESPTNEEDINVRANVKQTQPGTGGSSGGGQGGPFGFAAFLQHWQTAFNEQFQNLTNTWNQYVQNNTNINSNHGAQGVVAQSDEQKPSQSNNNWFSGLGSIFNNWNPNNQQPAGAQSDSPQPERPVIAALQNAYNHLPWVNNNNNNNNKPVEATQAPEPSKPAEGSNSVPVETKPEAEKDKEKEKEKEKPVVAQPVTQSGPIKQMIGNNPLVQGIAGTVQRITHTINPVKPRDEVKDASNSDVKGNNNNVVSSGIVEKSAAVDKTPDVPQQETVKEDAPVVPEKTD